MGPWSRPLKADRETEFLVVGGGPVGLAAALRLHRAGREVLVVDAGASVDKVCGEGLLPPGWAALEELGVAEHVDEKGPIREVVYCMPEPSSQRLRQLVAPVHRPSFGVRREVLCQAFARATGQRQLEIWRPARFRSLSLKANSVRAQVTFQDRPCEIDCRYLIGADGLHSPVRRQAGMQSEKPPRFSRWGTRVYLRQPPRSLGVTVTLGDGVESYMTPLGPDLHGLSFIWSPRQLGRPLPGTGPTWQRLLTRFPSTYLDTLPSLDNFFGEDRAIGPLQQRVDSPLHSSGRIALVGDAGGYLDALTGEGLCLGMLQSEALAELLLQNRLDLYPRAHRAIKQRHQIVVHLLLYLLARPGLKERFFFSLLKAPEVFRAMISTAVEHQPLTRLCNADMPRFLLSMLTGL